MEKEVVVWVWGGLCIRICIFAFSPSFSFPLGDRSSCSKATMSWKSRYIFSTLASNLCDSLQCLDSRALQTTVRDGEPSSAEARLHFPTFCWALEKG